jgi:hypothetical protein
MPAMKRYLVALVVVTLVATLGTFILMWAAPARYLPVISCMPLFFAVVTLVEHLLISRSLYQSPRRFVQVFLATTVGALALYLVAIAAYVLTHLREAYTFTFAFLIGFVVYFAFEIIAVYRLVEREKKNRK